MSIIRSVKLFDPIIYVTRSSISLIAVMAFYGPQLRSNLFTMTDKDILAYLSGMDIYHAIFWALIPAFLIICFLPIKSFVDLNIKIRFVLGIILAFIITHFPSSVFPKFQDRYEVAPQFDSALWPLALNIAILIIIPYTNALKKHAVVSKFLRWPVLLVDMIAPVAVWLEYSKDRKTAGNALFQMLRIFPALILCLPFCFVILNQPPSLYALHRLPINVERIDDENDTSIFIQLNREEDALLVSLVHKFKKISLREKATEYKTPEHIQLKSGSYEFVLDKKSGHLLTASTEDDYYLLTKIDSDTLKILERHFFRVEVSRQMGSAVMLWDPERQITVAVFEGGILRFTDDLTEISHSLRLSFAPDAILDPRRRLIYVCFTTPGMLIAYDADNLRVKKYLLLPGNAQRLEIDEKRDRLFISFPAESVIRVVDLTDFQQIDSIHSLLGVRTVRLDKARDLLFAGGFAPYIETYQADNYTLVGRTRSPHWQRSMTTSSQEPVAYFSTFQGIWKYNYQTLVEGNGSILDRYDPFFLLQHLVSPMGAYIRNKQMEIGERHDVYAMKPTSETVHELIVETD
jgi:hypothetical protein